MSPDVGGGFGAKMIEPEAVLVAWLARKLGQPVGGPRHAPNMLGLPQGAANGSRSRSAGHGTGRLLAYRVEVLGDGGAYPRSVPTSPT